MLGIYKRFDTTAIWSLPSTPLPVKKIWNGSYHILSNFPSYQELVDSKLDKDKIIALMKGVQELLDGLDMVEASKLSPLILPITVIALTNLFPG